MPLLDEKQSMTLAEYDALEADETKRYELIDRIIMMTPRPNVAHQSVATNLIAQLAPYFRGKSCRIFAELEVHLREDILVPDLSIICEPEKLTTQRCEGAPTLVVEILSPGTQKLDRFTKLYKYQLGGVPEYWVISPRGKSIIQYRFTGMGEEDAEVAEYNPGDTLTTPNFEGLTLALDELFAE